jgi:hypothetical protein
VLSQNKAGSFNMNILQETIESKLDKLLEHYAQEFDVGYHELEATEEVVALSKEVASYYKPLLEKLVEAAILTVNIVPHCAVYEVASVLPERKSYFNEGKILLFIDEDQVNGEDGKLKDGFQKRLGKFVTP